MAQVFICKDCGERIHLSIEDVIKIRKEHTPIPVRCTPCLRLKSIEKNQQKILSLLYTLYESKLPKE